MNNIKNIFDYIIENIFDYIIENSKILQDKKVKKSTWIGFNEQLLLEVIFQVMWVH